MHCPIWVWFVLYIYLSTKYPLVLEFADGCCEFTNFILLNLSGVRMVFQNLREKKISSVLTLFEYEVINNKHKVINIKIIK